MVTQQELTAHTGSSDAPWISLFGTVYDVTGFLPLHPGGRAILAGQCGGDGSAAFSAIHGPETLEKLADQLTIVGALEEESSPPAAAMAPSGPAAPSAGGGGGGGGGAGGGGGGGAATAAHFHLPDAIADMSPEQLSALTAGIMQATSAAPASPDTTAPTPTPPTPPHPGFRAASLKHEN